MTQPERELLLLVAKAMGACLPWNLHPAFAHETNKRIEDAIAAVERQEKEGKDVS